MHQRVRYLFGGGEIAFFGTLPDPEVPHAVFDDVGVEDVVADVEGVVGFEARKDLRLIVFDEFPGHQHAGRFSADETGSDHTGTDLEIVLRREVFPDHRPQGLVPGDHDAAHAVTGFRDVDTVLVQELVLLEEAVPEVLVRLGAVRQGLVHDLVEPARDDAAHDGLEGVDLLVVDVGQEHGRSVPLPDFDRADEDVFVVRKDVEEDGRPVADVRHAVEGVHRPHDGEIRDGVLFLGQFPDEGEEVTDEQVRGPGRLQVRQAVEDVVGLFRHGLDEFVERDREPLEPLRGWDLGQSNTLHLPEERRVFREPDVDDVAPVFDALFGKGFREQTEVVQLGQPADDVVSDAKIVQCFVQFREPGVHPIE